MPHLKALALGALTLVLCAAASSPAFAEVQLTIQNGRVSLVAKDATLRQILAEWARVGQTKIVNGDRVPGAPQTLQFNNLPEQQALETLLRGLSGYVAQARDTFDANLSRFDRILVMPTMASAVTAVGNSPAPPVFPQPGVASLQQAILPDDEDPTPNRGPMFNTFPQPQGLQVPAAVVGPSPNNPGPGLILQQPPATGPATTWPGSTAYPGGASVPGMVVPSPQQPGQPGLQIPQPPPQPPRRPGGSL